MAGCAEAFTGRVGPWPRWVRCAGVEGRRGLYCTIDGAESLAASSTSGSLAAVWWIGKGWWSDDVVDAECAASMGPRAGTDLGILDHLRARNRAAETKTR